MSTQINITRNHADGSSDKIVMWPNHVINGYTSIQVAELDAEGKPEREAKISLPNWVLEIMNDSKGSFDLTINDPEDLYH